MRRIEGRPRTPEAQRLYWVWAAMIQRCHNPNNPAFGRYGARGVTVCERWRTSFDAFLADMGLPPSSGMTIERRHGTLGYEPANCCWATWAEQSRNRPSWCRYYEIDGERLTMKDAWRRYAHTSVTYRALVKRLVSRGWDLERALHTPARAA